MGVTPDTIYKLLLQYFTESPEFSIPLADFVSTLPYTTEIPVHYWVHLKNAAEIDDNHMQKQGSRMKNVCLGTSQSPSGHRPKCKKPLLLKHHKYPLGLVPLDVAYVVREAIPHGCTACLICFNISFTFTFPHIPVLTFFFFYIYILI